MLAACRVLVHAAVGVVDPPVQRELRRTLLEPVDRHLLEERHRVVAHLAPQNRVQLAEQAGRLVVPAPPQVLRDCAQTLLERGHNLPESPRLADNGRELGPRGDQHPHVGRLEHALLDRLHDQYSLEQAAIEHRDAEKRSIRVLPRLREVLEPWM